MSFVPTQQALSRVQVFASETQEERWKADHDEAMQVRSFEITLREGIQTYDLLDALDGLFREKALEDPEKYAASVKEIEAGFRSWLEPCEVVDQFLQYLTNLGYDVDGAEDFRRRYEDAKWSLEVDGDPFDHPKFHELRERECGG